MDEFLITTRNFNIGRILQNKQKRRKAIQRDKKKNKYVSLWRLTAEINFCYHLMFLAPELFQMDGKQILVYKKKTLSVISSTIHYTQVNELQQQKEMLYNSLIILAYNFSLSCLIISFVISFIPGDLRFFNVSMTLKTSSLVTSMFALMLSGMEHALVCCGSYNALKKFIQHPFFIFCGSDIFLFFFF